MTDPLCVCQHPQSKHYREGVCGVTIKDSGPMSKRGCPCVRFRLALGQEKQTSET